MRAYHVEETRKGMTVYLVFAKTCREAVDKVRYGGGGHPDVECMDWDDEPGGIRFVRRAPEEDRVSGRDE